MRIEIKEKNILKNILCKRLGVQLDYDINGISIDSRQIEQGDIFFALKGQKTHGINFIDKNILNRLNFIISDKPIDSSKVFLVKDSLQFLKDIASDFRSELKIKFIGITGSNGKTSTKELLVKFLKTKFNIDYSKGNYNSTISLPLSLLTCNSKSDYCVLEMGASKAGEIDFLCTITKPHIGIITNISESHLDGYQDFNELIDTKLALYESIVNSGGTYFLNKDDSNINTENNYENIVTYSSFDKTAEYFADTSKIQEGIVRINDYSFNVPYKSVIFASNFLASFSIASSLGVDNQDIQDSLKSFEFPDGRGRITEVDGDIIIDDTYNANLNSMKSGISELKLIKDKNQSINLILGDMLDLGTFSKSHHSALGEFISDLNFIDNVYCIGAMSNYIVKGINNPNIKSKYFKNSHSIITYLRKNKSGNNIFYFKASRGMRMEKIIQKVFQ